jgi:hypothetical protein
MTKKHGFSQKSLLAKADRDFDYTPLAEANGNRRKRQFSMHPSSLSVHFL